MLINYVNRTKGREDERSCFARKWNKGSHELENCGSHQTRWLKRIIEEDSGAGGCEREGRKWLSRDNFLHLIQWQGYNSNLNKNAIVIRYLIIMLYALKGPLYLRYLSLFFSHKSTPDTAHESRTLSRTIKSPQKS